MKKVWKQPKLIVLFKGRPEEFVLAACKTVAAMGAGPNDTVGNNCENAYTGEPTCDTLGPS